MIKTIKTKQFKIIAALLAVVLTASCVLWNTTKVHAQEIGIENANVQGYSLLGSTRAIVNNKLAGDGTTLGLCVDDTNERYKADHELYALENGVWSFSSSVFNNDSAQMLFNGTSFDYIAYSPYYIESSSGYTEAGTKDYLHDNTTFSVPTDGNYGENAVTVDGSQYDLLWGKGTSTSATLDATLQHTLSMITVNVTGWGSEITNEPEVEKITIGGTVVTGDLNLTGATTASEVITVDSNASAADITAMKLATPNYIVPDDPSYGSFLASFEALIIPQTADLTITIELSDGRMFTSTVNSTEFVSGTAYNISLQVGQDKVTIGGITAESWNVSEGGELATE